MPPTRRPTALLQQRQIPPPTGPRTAGLTLVTCRNGSGKSSFAEAAELALTGNSARWSRRTSVWREGWRNLHSDGQTAVTVDLVTGGTSDTTRIEHRWEPGAELAGGRWTWRRGKDKRKDFNGSKRLVDDVVGGGWPRSSATTSFAATVGGTRAGTGRSTGRSRRRRSRSSRPGAQYLQGGPHPGMKATAVYSTDPETQELLEELTR